MATMKDILALKGARVASTHPDASVLQAAVLMNEEKIGALLVIEDGRMTGIFTERDILRRVVAQCRDAAATLVRDVMTAEVACCKLHTTLEEARGVMKNRRIRHLPVVDDQDRLLGLISIGDLNAYQNNTQEQTIHLLHQYIYGQV
jgi:CBS domain-containing protein